MRIIKKKPSEYRMRLKQIRRLKRRRMMQIPLQKSLENQLDRTATPQMKQEVQDMRTRTKMRTNTTMEQSTRMPRPRMLTEKRQAVRDRLIQHHIS